MTYLGLLLAAGFWLLIFGLKTVNFWAGMATAALVLTAYAVVVGGRPWRRSEWNGRALAVGVASAVALYLIFVAGNWLARLIFPFAPGQIGDVYGIRSEADPLLIGLILFFVTSPAEEIFWRGFLQRRFMERRGDWQGWLIGSLCYAAVHLFSGNLMLVLAALVAGLFWGLLFRWQKSIVPGVISHSVWTVLIFLLLPVAG
ncbi:MAG: CPBP family intramembrane metalloprotease [Limnochordales bacterium]|nr:CPBP family intramembrane metalloprotease [Limnochordales bacterium]